MKIARSSVEEFAGLIERIRQSPKYDDQLSFRELMLELYDLTGRRLKPDTATLCRAANGESNDLRFLANNRTALLWCAATAVGMLGRGHSKEGVIDVTRAQLRILLDPLGPLVEQGYAHQIAAAADKIERVLFRPGLGKGDRRIILRNIVQVWRYDDCGH
jgi:hypothetical protein